MYQLICKTCNAPFEGDKPDRRYCGRECYHASQKGGTTAKRGQGHATNFCEWCKTPFAVGGRGNPKKSTRFCQQSCASKAKGRDKGDCLACGAALGRGQRSYCSRDCFYASLQGRSDGRAEFVCEACGNSFLAYESHRIGDHIYCSRQCYPEGRVYTRGEDHPQWKGGTFINSSGYIYEIDRSLPVKADGSARYKARHVRVAEEVEGRAKRKGEVVHHLNADKQDNRPENLLLMTNSEHQSVHGFYSKYLQQHLPEAELRQITEDFLTSARKPPVASG